MNLYAVLGVERDSTLAKIKAAYRKRAKDLHPDKGGSEEAFSRLSLAYMVLRDKARRKKYDETGDVDSSEIDNDLKKIAGTLLSLFDAALKEDLGSRVDKDIIKLMQDFMKKVGKSKKEKVNEISDQLAALRRLSKRISCRKGNRNILGDIVDGKKRILENSRTHLNQELRILSMVQEELENYTCLVEVAQMVETHFFGVMAATSSTSSTL